jgi:putative oxidoreductase
MWVLCYIAPGEQTVMSFSETISPLIGRCALAWFYLSSAGHIRDDWHGVAAQMAARHVPLPPLVLLIVLVLLFLGVVSLLFGYQARHGAVMLFGLTIAAAVVMHDYWHIDDALLRQAQFEIFARDVAICGGLLLLVGMGPGPFSVDGKLGAKKKKD